MFCGYGLLNVLVFSVCGSWCKGRCLKNRFYEIQGALLSASMLLDTWVVWLVLRFMWLFDRGSRCRVFVLLGMLDVVLRMVIVVSFRQERSNKIVKDV